MALPFEHLMAGASSLSCGCCFVHVVAVAAKGRMGMDARRGAGA